MKACLVSKHYPPYVGGLESRVRDTARWLAARDVGVGVLTSLEAGSKKRELEDGVKVRRSRTFFSLFNAPFTPGILLDLMLEEFDVIEVNLPDPLNSIYCLIASVLKEEPLTVTYHADILRDRWYHLPFKIVYNIILDAILKRASIIFTTSPDYAKSSETLKKYLNKVVVAPSFIDPEKFNPKVKGAGVRKKHGLKKSKVILFAGRMVGYKGLEYLLEAFKSIQDKFDASLVLVGGGPLEDELKSKASALGLKNIHFAGDVSESMLPEYYAACDVFVLPSVTRQEAFGLVLAEAMACGKPVVSTNFSGMPYVVGDAGLLVEPRDVEGLASALLKVLGDRKLAGELGLKGRKRVEELFTQDAVCPKILEAYKLIQTKNKAG
jgi:glycosyltransferase involved in cell wall biosynthesis